VFLMFFFYSLSHYYFSDEDDVSSGSASFQQLDSHDQEVSHEEDRPAVVIPNHLLIHTEECAQLSFGSFGGFGSRPLSNSVEATSDVAPQIEHSDARYISCLLITFSKLFMDFIYIILTN